MDNEQETIQEVSEEPTDEENTVTNEETIESNTNDNDSTSNNVTNEETIENTNETENTQEEAPVVTSGESQSPNIENNSSEATAYNTVLIEEKLDTLIQLESHQVGVGLVVIGLLTATIVVYLFYKFITSFYEF